MQVNLHPTSFALNFVLVLLLGFGVSSCKKESVVVEVTAPEGELRVSDAALEQFIFRTYVDVIGTAPTEAQLAAWSVSLRQNQLTVEARLELVEALQTSEEYRGTYALNLYQAAKVRFIENYPDADISARFVNAGSSEDDERLLDLLSWQQDYLAGTANYLRLQELCVYNLVYDEINMGSFNFVRATFDNLLWRYPSNAEYQAGFAMVHRNEQRNLFNQTATDKAGYVDIVTTSTEALEGIVIWQYDQLLARRPTAAETVAALPALTETGNIIQLQRSIIQSDEYAGF